MGIVIAGLTPSWKVPKAIRETTFGGGRQSIGAIPVRLLVTGTKTSAGSAVADQDIVPIFSEDEADAYLGAGSEAAIQCYHALAIDGVTLYAAPVAEAGGATAGTATLTVGGTWASASAGTLVVFLAGKAFSVTVTTAMDTSDVAAAVAAEVNGDSRLFCTAAAVGAVVTFTTRSKGARMNDWILRRDLSAAPAGLTAALAGGTALTGGMVPFTNGAGADSIENVLALLSTDQWDFIAPAQNDTTNAALIRTHLNSEAGPLIMHESFAVMAKTRATATSTSFASGTLNNPRMKVCHLTNCELAPSAIAAQLAAVYSVTVGANPNTRYNGVELPTVPPQSQKGDIASDSVNNAMLNSGVTPLRTTPDGRVVIVRAIQSHCLNGSSPDFRTLDVGHVFVPVRLSKELGARWEVFSENNPYVGRDPAPGAEAAPAGVATPSLWNSEIVAELRNFERNNWLQDVDTNLPSTEYQPDGQWLMSAINPVVRLQNHIVGLKVRQTAAA